MHNVAVQSIKNNWYWYYRFFFFGGGGLKLKEMSLSLCLSVYLSFCLSVCLCHWLACSLDHSHRLRFTCSQRNLFTAAKSDYRAVDHKEIDLVWPVYFMYKGLAAEASLDLWKGWKRLYRLIGVLSLHIPLSAVTDIYTQGSLNICRFTVKLSTVILATSASFIIKPTLAGLS